MYVCMHDKYYILCINIKYYSWYVQFIVQKCFGLSSRYFMDFRTIEIEVLWNYFLVMWLTEIVHKTFFLLLNFVDT